VWYKIKSRTYTQGEDRWELLVEKVYSHLGTVRHRSEQVECRVEQHEKAPRDRLAALQTPAMA
jgi:hypothetical protein